MPGRSGGDRIKTTSVSGSTGTIVLAATAADTLSQAFPATLDGKQISYLIEQATNQNQWEVGRGVYTHSGRTLTRPAAQVRLSSAGAGVNVDFTAGLVVSVVGIWDDVDDLLHPPELTITGALTVTGDHLGGLLNYTGSGHTWTLNAATDSGYITVFNGGTGIITIAAGTATVTGETTIAVGSVGGILYSAAGTKAYVGNSSGPTYQEVNDPNGTQTNYQIARTSSDILVELITDLTAPRTFLLPSAPAEGDLVRVYRNAGGFHDWTNSTTGTALGYRNDYAAFQRASSAWKRIETRGRAGVRRESVSRALSLADNGATIAVTATSTYSLAAAVGGSTGWRVTLEQRGTGYVTLTIDTAGGLTQVGSSILQTTYDGDALIIEALGSSQVKVSHRPVETAALATSATSLATSTTAGRPRRTTATGAVTFQLDNLAPVGTSGLLIKGPGDITVQLAADVQYGQEGADFSDTGPDLLTGNFQCEGVMGWEVMAVDTTASPNIRKYLITGQTSLSLADPINLETGDTIGILQPVQGGTGVQTIPDLHALLAAIGFEPLYPDLPAIVGTVPNPTGTIVDVSAAHVAGVNPVEPTAGNVTIRIPSGLSLTAVPIGTQFRYLRRGVTNELIIAPADGTVTLEFPTGAANVARQHLSEIFLRRQSASSYRLSGDLRTNSPTNIGVNTTLSDAHRGITLRLNTPTNITITVPAAVNLSFGFYVTILCDNSSMAGSIVGSVATYPLTGIDAISLWKTTSGILLAGKGATSPQLVST